MPEMSGILTETLRTAAYFGLLAPEYKTMMVTAPVPDRLFVWRIDKARKTATLDMPNSKIGPESCATANNYAAARLLAARKSKLVHNDQEAAN